MSCDIFDEFKKNFKFISLIKLCMDVNVCLIFKLNVSDNI